jgi:predicted amidohydrolase YtcJ
MIEIGEPTGILIDNPMELVFNIIPKPSRKHK